MTPSQDYPRMMFHRGGLLTTVVLSREEEDALGPAWRRTVWPAEAAPPAEPVPASPLVGEQPEPPAAPAVPELEDNLDPWVPRLSGKMPDFASGENSDPPDANRVARASDEASAFEPAPKKRKRR